jgi:hypothetical protein
MLLSCPAAAREADLRACALASRPRTEPHERLASTSMVDFQVTFWFPVLATSPLITLRDSGTDAFDVGPRVC